MARNGDGAVLIGFNLLLGGVALLATGFIFGYAFTHGARAAGCLPLSTEACGTGATARSMIL